MAQGPRPNPIDEMLLLLNVLEGKIGNPSGRRRSISASRRARAMLHPHFPATASLSV